METPAETKCYTYLKGVVKFVRRKTTQQGRPMLLFAVVGENTTEVCTYFPSEGEVLFSVSRYYFVLNI